MKWIDFDKMEERHEEDDEEIFVEDWDDRFFEELADRNREDDDEEDVDAYCAVPQDAFSKEEEVVVANVEQYMQVPEQTESFKPVSAAEMEQSVAVKPMDTRQSYNTLEEQVEAVREREFEEIIKEEDETLSVTEKRSRFGRMLGLRMPETEDIYKTEDFVEDEVAPVENEIEQRFENEAEYESVKEEVSQDNAEDSKEQVSYDFEAQEESIASEVLDIEKIFTDYAVIREKIKTEYEDKREEPSEQEDIETSEEIREVSEESDYNTYTEMAQFYEGQETIEELMKKREAQMEQMIQDDETEEFVDEKDVLDTSFVDNDVFAQIEEVEDKNMESLPYEFDIDVDDFEEDAEEEKMLQQEQEVANIDEEERDEPANEKQVIQEEQEVMISEVLPESIKVSEGVLQKRSLPNRQRKNIEKVKPVTEEEVAVSSEKKQSDRRGKKIRKIQSDFEDEFLMEEDPLFKRDKVRRESESDSKESLKEKSKDAKNSKNAVIDEEEQDKPAKDFINLIITMVVVIAVTFILVEFVGQRTEVNGRSMEDTLHDGDNLIVDKISYLFGDPERFDIVIFPYVENGTSEEVYYIKRVIALPGEKVQIVNGMIYINGELLSERYGKGNSPILNAGIAEREIVLKEDEYFVLGDNRNDSTDSREIGPVTRDEFIGRAWLRIWPFSDFGFLEHQ